MTQHELNPIRQAQFLKIAKYNKANFGLFVRYISKIPKGKKIYHIDAYYHGPLCNNISSKLSHRFNIHSSDVNFLLMF